MSKRNFIMSANNNEDVFVFPIVPEINVAKPQNNEEFETIDNGTFNLIGKEGLRTFTVSSIFPSRQYPWLKPGSIPEPFQYIAFINKWRAKQVPFRVITSRPDGREWFNMPVTVEDFDFSFLRNGDVRYSISFKEYRFIEGVK